jgi:hypothetical protein
MSNSQLRLKDVWIAGEAGWIPAGFFRYMLLINNYYHHVKENPFW